MLSANLELSQLVLIMSNRYLRDIENLFAFCLRSKRFHSFLHISFSLRL